MRTLTLTIDERLAGRTVKSLLAQELRMSESLIRRVKLRETGILLNGVRAFTTACVRAGDESRRKRQTDYDKIRAVNALDLNAALGGALFGKHDVTEGERILGKDACGREYEQLRLHGAGKIRGVDVVKQHHRHEIAKQKPVELGNVLALNSAQMPCKASERHDEKYRNDRV